MWKAILGSIVRHGGNSLGTVLAGQGLATSDETTAAFGAAVLLGTFLWSVFQKWKSKDKPVGEV